MTLKDLLRKKSHIQSSSTDSTASTLSSPQQPQEQTPEPEREIPEFTFIRSTTNTQEIISPPSYPGDEPSPRLAPAQAQTQTQTKPEPKKSRHSIFRRASHNTAGSSDDAERKGKESEARSSEDATVGGGGGGGKNLPARPRAERKLSERLHLGARSRSSSSIASSNLPSGLGDAPETVAAPVAGQGGLDGADERERKGRKETVEEKAVKEEREALWEKRATVLALGNPLLDGGGEGRVGGDGQGEEARPRSRSRSVGDEKTEDSIQEAIRLHEEGDLERSTAIFSRLADPAGANNPLSQVLYGLALRHGWGIPQSTESAIHYLSLAASNSASIESAALSSGLRKGGAAKGELVLAIFELANCFRYGWGVKKDPVAARSYYETAANLGDVDALEESAWCYLEGFGGAKDKFKAAQYLRLAEKNGKKTVGNSWIWKDKYNPK